MRNFQKQRVLYLSRNLVVAVLSQLYHSSSSTSRMSPFNAQTLCTVLTHVGVGMGTASFWRGAWYVLDDHLFPENAEQSAAASLTLGTIGMAASQGLVGRIEQRMTSTTSISTLRLSMMRFGALYTIALSCVLVWRGTWVGWDCLYARLHHYHSPLLLMSNHSHSVTASSPDSPSTGSPLLPEKVVTVVSATDPGHATKSGALSHVVAISLLLSTGLFASVLAPPAAVSVIRDFTVRTATSSSVNTKPYSGPAQSLVRQLFSDLGGGKTTTTSTSAAASAARIYHNTAARRRLLPNHNIHGGRWHRIT